MIGEIVRFRIHEQKSQKMMNEQRMVLDLQIAIKKEQFRNYLKTLPEFRDGYKKKTEEGTIVGYVN